MSRRTSQKELHKLRDKKLSALRKEYHELWKADQDLGWVELDEPRFWGYQKTLVVRPDLLKTKKAHYLQQLCDIIQNPVRSRNKDFSYTEKKKGKTTTKIKKVHPKDFRDAVFEKKVPEKFHSEFERVQAAEPYYWGSSVRLVYKWRVLQSWRFVEKRSKYYITKVKLFDSEIVSRMKEIDNYIERNNLYAQFWRINNHRGSYWDRADREYQYLKEQRRALRDIKEAVIEYSLDKYQ